ncbi:hypothetical protein Cantr_02774 [Candida viswanathii]|uniref:Secreted protein CSS2 C-terminal domain-containing protein n=1 Tax=Candida viswanathii TaxID=5486 RepID=A0A367YN24_9ASCO|nr:hypothetical protein Cantr_02774 [Candida viswanathii]
MSWKGGLLLLLVAILTASQTVESNASHSLISDYLRELQAVENDMLNITDSSGSFREGDTHLEVYYYKPGEDAVDKQIQFRYPENPWSVCEWANLVREMVLSVFRRHGKLVSGSQMHGKLGDVWFRYWGTTAGSGGESEKRSIARAIPTVLSNFDVPWDGRTCCIMMEHGENWTGTLLIGSDSSAMQATCNRNFDVRYDAASDSLLGW